MVFPVRYLDHEKEHTLSKRNLTVRRVGQSYVGYSVVEDDVGILQHSFDLTVCTYN